MSFANPTPVRVGMKGRFAERNCTVQTRAVMGCEFEGETYYWNEFYLNDGTDFTMMLVHEEDTGTPSWRLFTEFTPETPITAAIAATKKVGDGITLEGHSAKITLVDESRVHFIEGQPPEWLTVGDRASYFNAEAGGRMWVVSWSGDEVEYYRGTFLPLPDLTRALGLSLMAFQAAKPKLSTPRSDITRKVLVGAGALALAALPLMRLARRVNPPAPHWPATVAPVPMQLTAAPPLKVGDQVTLDAASYRVTGHRVVQCSRVDARWESHQFTLADVAGQPSLLITHAQPDWQSWQLFKPLAASETVTPVVAAARRVGETVTLAGFSGGIRELFLSREQTRAGTPPEFPAADGLTYHYLARNNLESLLASWNGERVIFHRGAVVFQHVP